MKCVVIALALCSLSSAALAAPFCVATSYGENCWYYNQSDCQRAAANARGACVLNQQEMQERQRQANPYGGAPSGAPFCVVTTYGNNCWYYDADSCRRAAQSANGQCVYNR